jgi:hypothetical protein
MSTIITTYSRFHRPRTSPGVYAATALEATLFIGFCLALSSFSLA